MKIKKFYKFGKKYLKKKKKNIMGGGVFLISNGQNKERCDKINA